MKQILQHLKNGQTEIVEVPMPQCQAGHVLVQTHCSLISAGTERMLVEFGQSGLLSKARQQPDKVKMVLDKIRTDGLLPTIDSVFSKLDTPIPMGYSNVGHVIGVGKRVTGLKIGDRVLSNGYHAEVVCVPQNLCVKVPDRLADDQAVFGVLGSIALQGIRLAKLELGECVAIFGLGLLGLITVQLLRAQGCRVLAIDMNAERLALAKSFGAEIVDLSVQKDPVKTAMHFSHDRGVDAVLITAASKSSDIVHQAAQMSRVRGRIILVGVVGLNLSRADFYKKELTFQVSCSYGPGRYDEQYEKAGHDYPIGFVRFTEQRNFETVLDLMADDYLHVDPLVTHRYSLEDAVSAYQLLMDASVSSLGIVLNYSTEKKAELKVDYSKKVLSGKTDTVVVGFIGAGNFAARQLIPAFKKTGVTLKTIVSSGGVSAQHLARKFNFISASTDVNAVLNDPEINTVVIATPHNSHAEFICRALKHGKKIYAEKPLAINEKQLNEIISVYSELLEQGKNPFLMVGFNRRFSPLIKTMDRVLSHCKEPKAFVMTINAGFIPKEHWTQNLEIGGGRIIGEACHMVDLLRFLAHAEIVSIQTQAVGQAKGKSIQNDQVTITLNFADGSLGTIHYLSSGHKSLPKERLEVFCGGRILQLDNFRSMRGYGFSTFKREKLWRQDKGHQACVSATVHAIREGLLSPIPFNELVEVTKSTFSVMDIIA